MINLFDNVNILFFNNIIESNSATGFPLKIVSRIFFPIMSSFPDSRRITTEPGYICFMCENPSISPSVIPIIGILSL